MEGWQDGQTCTQKNYAVSGGIRQKAKGIQQNAEVQALLDVATYESVCLNNAKATVDIQRRAVEKSEDAALAAKETGEEATCMLRRDRAQMCLDKQTGNLSRGGMGEGEGE